MSESSNKRKRKRCSDTYSNKENINCEVNIPNSAVNNLTSSSFACQNISNFCGPLGRPQTFNFFPANLVDSEPPSYHDEQQLQKRRRLSNIQMQSTQNFPPLFFQKIQEIVHSIEVIHENVLFNLLKMRNKKISEVNSKFNMLEKEGPTTCLRPDPQTRNEYFSAQYFYQQSLKNDFYAKMNSITNFYNQQKERLTFQISSIMQEIRVSSTFSNDSMSIQVPVPKGPCSMNDYFISYELITLPLYMAADFIKDEEVYTSYYSHM